MIRPNPSAAKKQSDAAPPTQSAPAGRRRYLLPSGHVAEFKTLKVGEFLEVREGAIVDLATIKKDPTPIEFGFHLGRVGLRKLLVGISEDPAPTIYRKGFDPAAVRAEVEASAADDEKRGVHSIDVESTIAARLEAAEDVDAMKAAARLAVVNDYEWEHGKGYLSRLPEAEPGTLEAADWFALNEVAQTLMNAFATNAPLDPKAPRPRTRPLR